MITNQKDLRNAFWEAYPQYQRKGNQEQNQYPADIRMAWCDYVEYMCRTNQISGALCNRATL